MTTLVRINGEIVATVGATRFFLAPRIESLPDRDDLARTVRLMCAHALDISAGRAPGPYSDEAALRLARQALTQLDGAGHDLA